MAGALDGIRVIDFGQYIAGPLAAVMLSDEGADVIHVDPPGGPMWQHPSDAFFNRGKRRITLDLKTADGVATAQRLIYSADVVIENFRPGVMQRLGLGADAMCERNSSLVYCSMPGFAADDPRAGMRAWEGVLDAATENCIPRVGEPPDDWDWSRPTYSAVSLASNFGGFLGATGIVMALIARQRTGLGQKVEVPLYDAMFTLLGHSGSYLDSKGLHPPTPIHGRGAGCFRCKDDKYVQFDTSSSRHLTWFAREAGLTVDWAPLLDLAKNRAPKVNEELHARLRELFATKTASEWEDIGNRAGAAIGWARNTTEWIHTKHAQELGAVVQLDDPQFGPTWTAGLPVRLTATPGQPQGPRHLPGADNAAVIAELEALGARPSAIGSEPNLANPLEGMKVVDLCLALAGPTCGRLLLEFGAEVIKVQKPHAGVGGYLNRGKRSILLDLEPPDAQQVFWGMVDGADVLLENFSPGTTDRLGIGYEEARARNPDIVYTSISCYGQVGPWRSGRGWERQGQAVAGIMERTGVVPAILGPYNLIDIGTGVMGTFATGLGLFHRLRSGEGQHVQASLCQTATYQQTPYMLDYEGHVAEEPKGYEALGTDPTNRFYQASDRWFFLAANLPDEKNALRQVEGLDGLADVKTQILDHMSKPATEEGLRDYVLAQLEAFLESRFAKEPAAVWVERLTKAGVPAHAIVTAPEIMVDESARARGMSVSQDVEGIGRATMPGLSVHLSRTPMRLGDRCHQPGSDGPAILAELGMSDQLEGLDKKWMLQTKDLPPAWSGG